MIVTSTMTSREAPWVHVIPDGAESSGAILTVENLGGRAVRLNGSMMGNPEGLFREYVREFRFPEYFGWNWAAFYECMTELEQFPARSYLTLVSHASQVLEGSLADFRIYLSQLGAIGKSWANAFGRGQEWGGGEVPFNTVFLCAPARMERFDLSG
jgi:hypothetical protein